MASCRYCVFWIPTSFHAPIEIISPGPKIIDDLSDGQGPPHKITIHISDFEKEDLEIKSECNGQILYILLKLIDKGENGLFQYSYEIDESVAESILIDDKIPNAIYHCIKSFYHEHLNHDRDGDAVTEVAFPSKRKINLKEDDNPALIHYLDAYKNKFIAFAQDYTSRFAFLHENINVSNPDQRNRLIDKRKLLTNEILNTLGEWNFCEALLRSKYNKSYRIDAPTPRAGTNKAKYMKGALNMKSAIDIIKLIHEKNLSEYDTLINDQNRALHNDAKTSQEQGGTRSLFVGFTCAIAGIAASIILFFCTPGHIIPTIKTVGEIRGHVDTLRNDLNDANAIIKSNNTHLRNITTISSQKLSPSNAKKQ